MRGEGESGRAAARERLYDGALRAARALSPVAGALIPSLSRDLSERRAAAYALEEWAIRSSLADGRPLLWLHGASAGEILGAGPAVEALRRRLSVRLAVTHFSPSGAAAAASLEPDWYGYPPFDEAADCRRAVRAASPAALVFAAGDVWPGLCRAAAEAGVPLGMVNGMVRPGSSRLRPPARWLLAPGYGRLDLVGAVSMEDADRLRRLGVRPAVLRITGDAAFDRALARADRARQALAGAAPSGGDPPVLVAGSTWPEDEEALLRSAAGLASRGVDLRLVLVPHQPHARHVEALGRRCLEVLRRKPVLWSEAMRAGVGVEEGDSPAVRLRRLLSDPAAAGRPLIVDAVGFLADLYPVADLAWVGGGFGRAGLHSVIEPAAAGIPVLFGPRHERREARSLLERGAARAADPRALPGALADLVRSAEARREAGEQARAYVEEGAGAATATAGLLVELLDGARS